MQWDVRRVVLVTGWTLVWSGTLILGFVAFQLYGTGLQTAVAQGEARQELEVVLATSPSSTSTTEVSAQSAPTPVIVTEKPVAEGDPFAAIRIPAIGVDDVVFEGVQVGTLKKGPGHIPGTSLPGQPGNAAISGHRTTYGQPFYDLDALRPGDAIFVDSVTGTHVYEVRSQEIVSPTDVWVLDDREGGWLTLTTCHPRFSARQRLVVFAQMIAGPNKEAIEAT